MLYKLFREVVLLVSPESVVQVVIDNASNYVVVVRLLEQEFRTLHWSFCVMLKFCYKK